MERKEIIERAKRRAREREMENDVLIGEQLKHYSTVFADDRISIITKRQNLADKKIPSTSPGKKNGKITKEELKKIKEIAKKLDS